MFFKSFLQTLPVLIAYLPLGIAFGILFSTLEIKWYFGILIAIFVFTGAGQFLLTSLLSINAGLLEIGIASFLLNIRHMFYSLAITQEIKNFGLGKYYILFGLTDETFALLKTHQQEQNFSLRELQKNYIYITFLNHIYWVIGCGLGIFIGKQLEFTPKGIEFSLTALFSVLTLSLLQNSPNKIPFIIALVIGIIGLFVFPSEQFLLFSLLCGIFCLLFGKKWIDRG
ncbi:AzlC family ABC transporter permease [Helicobacter mesocricetorum]|uniref:AzlC family ABC transporter permease n=1 Tax=Helicobacter mesocricetorum TaxID=87012 RepID=UPI000CF1AB5E|nr:AzlC family ABC transporter permease [Helicobacter mesocricetorum]